MPRKPLYRTTEFPYHITARVNNRENFPAPLEFIWKTITGELFLRNQELDIHAFVLMPNHFHLVASGPSIDVVMKEVQGSSTRIINTRARRSGHLFGGRYHWSLISEAYYYLNVYKYVLRNPVKAGFSKFVGDYPYSSYACWLGKRPLPFALVNPDAKLTRLIPEEVEELDQWLNIPHRAEVNEAIRNGLKKKVFSAPIDRRTRRPVDLSDDASLNQK